MLKKIDENFSTMLMYVPTGPSPVGSLSGAFLWLCQVMVAPLQVLEG